MKELLTSADLQEFLIDFEQNSETVILEEGKEKDEVVEIAKTRGINLKDNTDLAGFKTIYTFADKANKNKARLPKQKLMKALPTLIGKPVDIDHDRRFVVGHYIDYRYIVKDDMVVAYGVFYKSNFGEEWEEMKSLFKSKQLATSYEIWCPKNKRHFLSDGTYELTEMEIAGGAILLNEDPAFPEAKVLELAKKIISETEKDLVFASKYQEEDIIVANGFKESVEQNLRKIEAEKMQAQTPPINKVKCAHCSEEFDSAVLAEYKCPKCFSILGSTGEMKYPPQIFDFRIQCPHCRTQKWLLVNQDEKNAIVKCQDCAQEYKVDFKQPEKTTEEVLQKIPFVYMSNVSCYQCGAHIPISGFSTMSKHTVTCHKCGLRFSVDTEKLDRFKSVQTIEEYIAPPPEPEKPEERRQTEEMKEEEKKEEKVEVKVEEKKEEVKETPKVEEKSEPKQADVKVEPKVEEPAITKSSVEPEASQTSELITSGTSNTDTITTTEAVTVEEISIATTVQIPLEEVKTEGQTEEAKKECEEEEVKYPDIDRDEVDEEAKKLKYQERKAISDDLFAVVKTVKNRKIRMFPIHDEAHVRNALARLPQATETLQRLGISPRVVKARILRRARQLKMTELVKRHKEEASIIQPTRAEKLLKRACAKIVSLKKASKLAKASVESSSTEVEKIKKEADEKIEMYKANAKLIVERRFVIGDFGKDLSDKDIADDKLFDLAIAQKENAELKAKLEQSNEVIGDKPEQANIHESLRNEITQKAFGNVKRVK